MTYPAAVVWLAIIAVAGAYFAIRYSNRYMWQGAGLALAFLAALVITADALRAIVQ